MRPPSSPLYSVYSRILPRHPLPRPPHFSILLLPTIIISSSSEAEITRFAKSKQKRSWRTDQRTHPPTDGRMDGRTDRPSYRDAWTHLKTQQTDGFYRNRQTKKTQTKPKKKRKLIQTVKTGRKTGKLETDRQKGVGHMKICSADRSSHHRSIGKMR